jgi:hypothetical protein
MLGPKGEAQIEAATSARKRRLNRRGLKLAEAGQRTVRWIAVLCKRCASRTVAHVDGRPNRGKPQKKTGNLQSETMPKGRIPTAGSPIA